MERLEEIDESWRIGEVAAATGVTVRTLHHYDALGLLHPGSRSTSGHRLYGRVELERLYVIVALRRLGLSLAAIAEYLDEPRPDADRFREVLLRHLESVERELERHAQVRNRLHGLLRLLDVSDRPPLEEIRKIVEVTTMHQKYYTPEQLAELEERRNELGEEGMVRAQKDWEDLIAQVRAERDSGTDPADPRMQELVVRWNELIQAFTGGDPGIGASLQKMYDAEGVERASQGMGDPELMAYVQAAMRSSP